MRGGGTSDLAALAREFGLQIGESAKYTRSGGTPLGNNADLNEVVFGPDVVDGGRIGGPVALGTDRLVLVKVSEHQPARARPLAEVLDEVVAAVRKDGGSAAARKAADEAVKQLAGGADLSNVLKPLGVSATPARMVGRGDPQLPVQVRDAAFTLPFTTGKNSYKSVPLEDGGAAILAVSQVKPGVTGANSANDQQQAGQWVKREREVESAAYQLELRRRATIKRNTAAFN
jgi:peptidyl-prolyl cis-trans isomerase D